MSTEQDSFQQHPKIKRPESAWDHLQALSSVWEKNLFGDVVIEEENKLAG